MVVLCRFAFDELHLHRLEICIVPRNTNSRRVMEKLLIREEGVALRYLRDQRRVGGPHPVWDHRGGVAAATRRPGVEVDRLTSRSDQSIRRMACALARRMVVRRFHIFIFQCFMGDLPACDFARSAS